MKKRRIPVVCPFPGGDIFGYVERCWLCKAVLRESERAAHLCSIHLLDFVASTRRVPLVTILRRSIRAVRVLRSIRRVK